MIEFELQRALIGTLELLGTIGFGNNALVKEIATAGSGYHSTYEYNETYQELEEKVTHALSMCKEPCLIGCRISHGDSADTIEDFDNILRHQLIHRAFICSEKDFEKLVFRFNCQQDPISRKPIAVELKSETFVRVG